MIFILNKGFRGMVKEANCALSLDRRFVGVRFLYTEEDFKNCDIEGVESRFTYCTMVLKATKGRSLKVNSENFGCFAGARALGIVETENWYRSGQYYGSCGLYKDLDIAKLATDSITRCSKGVYGLEIRPADEFIESPDVIIVISSPYNIMRLVQGYSHINGPYQGYKFMGNQAICSECTAYPYESKEINISLLCRGARNSGFKDGEIALGISIDKFKDVIDGLVNTINPVEPNFKKREIEERLKSQGESSLEILYNKNYGDELHGYDCKRFLDKKK